jgi:hypothetical protein
MTKSEIREVTNLSQYNAGNMKDVVARGLSALIRAARTKTSRVQLMRWAEIFEVTNHPDFIV